MAIYYIENENGNILSEDGSKHFMKLSGKQAYEYLKSEEGRQKRFMRTSSHEDGGEEEFVEVPSTHIRRHRRDERHEQYVSDCIEGSGLITISLYAMEDDKNSDYASGEELIADSSSSVEEQALHDMDLEALHRALQTLNDDELRMIHALYFSKKRCSERQLAKKMGISHVAVHKRKNTILEKLKKFF